MPPSTEAGIHNHATEFMDETEAVSIEDTIWWAAGRRAILDTFLKTAKQSSGRRLENILEVGCGGGGDLALLAKHGKVWGVELSPRLAQRARRRGVAQGIYAETDVFDDKVDRNVDLLCMFDVLEHIEDDDLFVRRLSEKPGHDHLFLLTVPAFQFLFGPHDELLHHFRRYSRPQLVALLERHGYEIVSGGYFMFLLFPLAVMSRLWEGLKRRLGFKPTEVNIGRVPGPLNWLMTAILRLEARLGRHVRFPFGLWIVMLVRHR